MSWVDGRFRPERKVIHTSSWEEFRRLAKALRPGSISYAIQRAPLSKPPVGLRITFATKEVQYVFLDFARGENLQRIGGFLCAETRQEKPT